MVDLQPPRTRNDRLGEHPIPMLGPNDRSWLTASTTPKSRAWPATSPGPDRRLSRAPWRGGGYERRQHCPADQIGPIRSWPSSRTASAVFDEHRSLVFKSLHVRALLWTAAQCPGLRILQRPSSSRAARRTASAPVTHHGVEGALIFDSSNSVRDENVCLR